VALPWSISADRAFAAKLWGWAEPLRIPCFRMHAALSEPVPPNFFLLRQKRHTPQSAISLSSRRRSAPLLPPPPANSPA